MRGGPEFSVGNDFVLGHAVLCVPVRLLYLSKKRCVVRRLLQLSTEANGPAAAGLAAPFVARSASLDMGAGLLQATLAAALHIIPPLIPPPTWNNEPLTCGLDGFVLLAYSVSNDICQCFSVSADDQWSQLFWIGVVSSEDTLFYKPGNPCCCHCIGIFVDHSSRRFDGRCHGRHA